MASHCLFSISGRETESSLGVTTHENFPLLFSPGEDHVQLSISKFLIMQLVSSEADEMKLKVGQGGSCVYQHLSVSTHALLLVISLIL